MTNYALARQREHTTGRTPTRETWEPITGERAHHWALQAKQGASASRVHSLTPDRRALHLGWLGLDETINAAGMVRQTQTRLMDGQNHWTRLRLLAIRLDAEGKIGTTWTGRYGGTEHIDSKSGAFSAKHCSHWVLL